jgi:hypothetical protein
MQSVGAEHSQVSLKSDNFQALLSDMESNPGMCTKHTSSLMHILQTSLWWWFQGSLAASVPTRRINTNTGTRNQEPLAGEVRLDDDDPDMVKGIPFYLYTFKYLDNINSQATRIQQGEIQEDGLYHCDTLVGKVFGTKK